jgi:hypothetical protein
MYLKIFIFLTFHLISCREIKVKNSSDLKKALNEVQAGDIIFLNEGVYKYTLKPTKNGTEKLPITLKGSRNSIITNPDKDGIYLDTLKWWILDGFD